MSIRVKFKAESDFGDKHSLRADCEITWDKQVEAFYEFLIGQGFIITYSSFLEFFGNVVEERTSVYKEKRKKK